MDEHILLQGKSANLENDFVDENLQPLSWWIERYNKYSTREAKCGISCRTRGRRESAWFADRTKALA